MTKRTLDNHAIMPVLRMVVTAILSADLAAAASSLAITAPTDGSAASPGTSVQVMVAPTGSFSQVVIVGEGPIGFSQVLTTPPYQFSVPIPAGTSPGRYSLMALGATTGGSVISAPITLAVERTDAPVQFDVTPTTLTLPVGQRMALRVVSTYADGTKLDTTRSAATTYSSTAPGVATVDSQGNVVAVSAGSAQVMVNNFLRIPVVIPATMQVAPQWPVLYASQSMGFSAFSPGMAALQVKWSISPQVGSVDGSGNYTAPRSIAQQQAVMITATVKNNPSQTVTTGVALFPPVSVSLSPTGPVVLSAGQTARFAQTVLNALDEEVTWSISPANAGTIDNTGLYTAPAKVTGKPTVTVTAKAVADASKTATATITLQP